MSDFVDINPDIEDRGEAKYFHGRKGILDSFERRLKWADKDPKKGTTFLIQAAPGAGKSALLYKCGELAEGQDWKVVDITLDALWDATTLLQALGQSKDADQVEGAWSASMEGEVGIPGAGRARWGGSYERKKTPAPRNTLEVLKNGKGKLLLVLDEAQRLGKHKPPDHAHRISNLLDAIHNGKIAGRPVMLAVAGLSATADAFEGMGVSRFKANCYVELGPLKSDAEREVIKDWLKKEGRAKGDPTPWIDAITRETHGWPQHMAAYAQSAALQVRGDKRKMTPQGLQAVLEAGRSQRIKFYEIRAKELDEDHRAAIAEAFANTRKDQTQTRKAIMDPLVKAVGKPEADTVFKRALRKGILDHRNERYAIPIPSMCAWFIDNYYIERDPPDQSPTGPDFPPDRPSD